MLTVMGARVVSQTFNVNPDDSEERQLDNKPALEPALQQQRLANALVRCPPSEQTADGGQIGTLLLPDPDVEVDEDTGALRMRKIRDYKMQVVAVRGTALPSAAHCNSRASTPARVPVASCLVCTVLFVRRTSPRRAQHTCSCGTRAAPQCTTRVWSLVPR